MINLKFNEDLIDDFNKNGFLITNNHVIDKCKSIDVIHDDKSMVAEIISSNEMYDLGLLKVDYKNKVSITISNR